MKLVEYPNVLHTWRLPPFETSTPYTKRILFLRQKTRLSSTPGAVDLDLSLLVLVEEVAEDSYCYLSCSHEVIKTSNEILLAIFVVHYECGSCRRHLLAAVQV